MTIIDTNKFVDHFSINNEEYRYYSLPKFAELFNVNLSRIPFSRRILLENLLRFQTLDESSLASYSGKTDRFKREIIQFHPARILLQDYTGIPLLVDLASMRDAAWEKGINPSSINPVIPVDLVIDHSLQVDQSGTANAILENQTWEYRRNRERYEFLRWAQLSFQNLRIIPPASGIVHQVNVEYLSPVVQVSEQNGEKSVFPDTVLGTDSHTTMVNGLGVLGWGVGGIEAIAAMLGEGVEFELPPVVGVRLTGELSEGTMPTDLVLTLTELLRIHGVVNKIVEFYGPALDQLSAADRNTIANMAPEFGATSAFFPIDQLTLDYMIQTGRSELQIGLVKTYSALQELFRTSKTPDPDYDETLTLNLASVKPSIAGPTRPQDRVSLQEAGRSFTRHFDLPRGNPGENSLQNGSIVLAAITSCTNTSNPYSMIAAGLLAKKAQSKGLKPKAWTKTSFAPGSRAVGQYLDRAGLLQPLENLGFNIIGYGCTTCIGNSGPLLDGVSDEIRHKDLTASAVISGNRNFSGRVHPDVKANYLASPALVVAYALLGSILPDITTEPLGVDSQSEPVFLRDIWPTSEEIHACLKDSVLPDFYKNAYAHILEGDDTWKELTIGRSPLYPWDPNSTYIQPSPFCKGAGFGTKEVEINQARALLVVGDSITTDHISPAGSISVDSPAGEYLLCHGQPKEDFNSFGARRGNAELMVRGAFDSLGFINLLAPEKAGRFTRMEQDGPTLRVFNAAEEYRKNNVPLMILAGKEYGTGSSRDWAAKGPRMLGVRAVIAESFERIHRSNLVMMGILPLQYHDRENLSTLHLTGFETFSLTRLTNQGSNGTFARVSAFSNNNEITTFEVKILIDQPREWEYFSAGGLLPYLIEKIH